MMALRSRNAEGHIVFPMSSGGLHKFGLADAHGWGAYKPTTASRRPWRPYGWEGASQRPTDRTPNLTSLIQMGARPYAPQIGRFLAVDPVEGGATTNPYGYVNDPVNTKDLSGECVFGTRKGGGCKGGIRPVANLFNASKRAVKADKAGRAIACQASAQIAGALTSSLAPNSGGPKLTGKCAGTKPITATFRAPTLTVPVLAGSSYTLASAALSCAQMAPVGAAGGLVVIGRAETIFRGTPASGAGATFGYGAGMVAGCLAGVALSQAGVELP
jgi:RHS repeat-associated protein